MEIKGVSIDSRSIKPGELFVAIKGDNHDGHDFVQDAIKKGASAALVERAMLETKFASLGSIPNVLPVEDTLYALQEMSYMHRKRFAIPVVGITGSNGKTTTKEMLATILKQRGPVLKNEGNLNNHIGVPLTLLKLNAEHTSAVVEMGMSAPGEIDVISRLASPTIGVITNVGPAHLEFFGELDRVADAKAEILENIRPGGTAIVNADDQYYAFFKKKYNGRSITFGIDAAADVRALDVQQQNDSTTFTLTAGKMSAPVRIATLGRHNVYNALAAAAAAYALEFPLDLLKSGLESFAPVSMRSEIKRLKDRTILADYYNANPASMAAALATLRSMNTSGKRIAVLGDMLELGDSSPEAHTEIGAKAAEAGADVLICVGKLASFIAKGAIEAGMPSVRVFETERHEEATALLREHSTAKDVVLIKGSRGMKMEKILEGF